MSKRSHEEALSTFLSAHEPIVVEVLRRNTENVTAIDSTATDDVMKSSGTDEADKFLGADDEAMCSKSENATSPRNPVDSVSPAGEDAAAAENRGIDEPMPMVTTATQTDDCADSDYEELFQQQQLTDR